MTSDDAPANASPVGDWPRSAARLSSRGVFAHDVPHPIGDPDDDDGGLVDDDEDDEDPDEDDEEPLQVRRAMRRRSTQLTFLL